MYAQKSSYDDRESEVASVCDKLHVLLPYHLEYSGRFFVEKISLKQRVKWSCEILKITVSSQDSGQSLVQTKVSF